MRNDASPALTYPLVRAKRRRVDRRTDRRGQAKSVEILHRVFHLVDTLVFRPVRQQVADQVFSTFFQGAVRLPGSFIAMNDTAVGVRRIFGDARERERFWN